MGIIWKCMMPLLSTLAALVILVHSAEEDFEMRQHAIQARNVHENMNSDEPWRVLGLMDADGYPNDSHPRNLEEDKPVDTKEPPRRRKPKRRPQLGIGSRSERISRPQLPSEGYQDMDYEFQQSRHTIPNDSPVKTQPPRRRRKRPEMILGPDKQPYRMKRRRGHKRKQTVTDKDNAEPPILNKQELLQDDNYQKPGDRYKEEGLPVEEPGYSNLKEQANPIIESAEFDHNRYVDNNVKGYKRKKQGHLENFTSANNDRLSEFRSVINHENGLDNKERETTEKDAEVQSVFAQIPNSEEYNINTNIEYAGGFTVGETAQPSSWEVRPTKSNVENNPFDTKESGENQHKDHLMSEFDVKAAPTQYIARTAQDSQNDQEQLNDQSKESLRYALRNYHKVRLIMRVLKAAEKAAYAKKDNTSCNDNSPHMSNLFMVTEDQDPVKAESDSQIDLKDILKRSNGTSLSELLQKHNLSLSDLLRGGSEVLSILNDRISSEENNNRYDQDDHFNDTKAIMKIPELKANANENDDKVIALVPIQPITQVNSTEADKDKQQPKLDPVPEKETKSTPKRLLNPVGRRKLRFRIPKRNHTVKFQASRDFISLDARKNALSNLHYRKNKTNEEQRTQETQENTKEVQNDNKNMESHEPNLTSGLKIIMDGNEEISDFTSKDDDSTTTLIPITTISTLDEGEEPFTTLSSITETEILPTTFTLEDLITEASGTITTTTTTHKPTIVPIVRQRPSNNQDIRRQALTNRLKRKRMKQRTTSQSPLEDISEEFYNNANLVSASEFITHSVPNPTTNVAHTTFEDIMMTESSVATERSERRRTSTTRKVIRTTTPAPPLVITTAEIAKLEIQEILNDTKTGRRLSKILMERNMTFNELLQHRERGSSQVHLADIFVNASRDPDPTEPFLSKSSIEPISKETYPLRAILEANLHETTIKATSELYTQPPPTNIPVVMDFGNNVNENGENLGIMSIFNKVVSNENTDEMPFLHLIKPNSEDNTLNAEESRREGREFPASKEVTLNEIFSMMQRSFKNATDELSESFTKALSPNNTHIKLKSGKSREDEDIIISEDLQNLRDSDSKVSIKNDDLEVTVFERRNEIGGQTVFDKIPGATKSVTVVTASILGLAMVLFLLTYAMFKWKQQRSQLKNKDCLEENIPTPVFENRKSKKNCSIRSISPMLSSSNIYSLNTLDSQNDKDSHDYVMWDTHRTPFQ